MYVDAKDPNVVGIIQACYPDYKGKKCKIETRTTYRLSNYWSEGSRDYIVAYNLLDGSVRNPSTLTENPFHSEAHADIAILPGVLLVRHIIFQGKDLGISILCHPDTMTKFLPASEENILTERQKGILLATRSLLPIYRKKRFTKQSVTMDELRELQVAGLLNGKNTLTLKGKNTP